jgi:hypothetical protein
MGRALNALIELARDDEWTPVRVEATVLLSPGNVIGTWYAEPDWFEGLSSYRLSETEFSQRVLATIDGDDGDSREPDGAGAGAGDGDGDESAPGST